MTENSTISRVDCGLDQDPDLIKKKLISFPGTLLLDFFCESGQVWRMQFLEIGITSRYHPFWPFWKMVFVFIRHACCRFGTQLSMLFLQLLPKLQLCLFFGWNKCCRFVQKIFLMLTTNVAKSHGKRSLFFHDIFMRKFSTPLHWSCCLLLSNIVKIDLISSSHFFWPPLSKLIFYSILWLFLFTCQNPSENFGDHFSLSFHYEGRNWPFSKSVFWTIT